jgi:hypothetical protein
LPIVADCSKTPIVPIADYADCSKMPIVPIADCADYFENNRRRLPIIADCFKIDRVFENSR